MSQRSHHGRTRKPTVRKTAPISGRRALHGTVTLLLVLTAVVLVSAAPVQAAAGAVAQSGADPATTTDSWSDSPTFSTGGDEDLDGDGLSNERELALGTDPATADTDGDGLDDGREAQLGSNPTMSDTDGDGLSDGVEAARDTDPTVTDTDADGLGDGEEVREHGTDPTSADSDGDGLGDKTELAGATNPLDPDIDNDGLSDGAEGAQGTDPTAPDSDGDGLVDGVEVGEVNSDPTARDTDGDLLNDRLEVQMGIDPTNPFSPATFLGIVLGFVVGIGGAGVLLVERAPIGWSKDRRSPGPPPSGEARDATASDDVSDDADLTPDDVMVEGLLRGQDGRMKQGAIIEMTDWSKAKVSRLLSGMAERGQVTKVRLGRENLICLSGHEPDALKPSTPA